MSFADPVATRIIAAYGPFDIVADFAAHNYLRSVKDIFSINALLNSSLFCAQTFWRQVTSSVPEHFFCVSTDKTVSTASIVGASKQLTESMSFAVVPLFPATTSRSANVAFSDGGLLGGFIHRRFRRQPHSALSGAKRYFISPEQCGQFCPVACFLGAPSEVYFPNIDPSADLKKCADVTLRLLESIVLTARLYFSEAAARAWAFARDAAETRYLASFFESDTSGKRRKRNSTCPGKQFK